MRFTIEELKNEYQKDAEALELLEEQKSDKQDEINEIEDLIKLIQLKGNLDNQIELCDEEINKINSFSVDFNTGAINLKNQISEKNEKVDYKNKLLECKKYIIDNKKNNENEIETLERLKEEKQNEIDKLEGEKQSKIKMLEHLNKVCTEQITKIQKKAETIEPIKNEINELERKINKIREYKFYTDEDIELITKYEKERGDKEKELSKINTEDNNSRLENIGKENMKVELSDLLERINMTLKYEKNKSDNNKENDNTIIGENENIIETKEEIVEEVKEESTKQDDNIIIDEDENIFETEEDKTTKQDDLDINDLVEMLNSKNDGYSSVDSIKKDENISEKKENEQEATEDKKYVIAGVFDTKKLVVLNKSEYNRLKKYNVIDPEMFGTWLKDEDLSKETTRFNDLNEVEQFCTELNIDAAHEYSKFFEKNRLKYENFDYENLGFENLSFDNISYEEKNNNINTEEIKLEPIEQNNTVEQQPINEEPIEIKQPLEQPIKEETIEIKQPLEQNEIDYEDYQIETNETNPFKKDNAIKNYNEKKKIVKKIKRKVAREQRKEHIANTLKFLKQKIKNIKIKKQENSEQQEENNVKVLNKK